MRVNNWGTWAFDKNKWYYYYRFLKVKSNSSASASNTDTPRCLTVSKRGSISATIGQVQVISWLKIVSPDLSIDRLTCHFVLEHCKKKYVKLLDTVETCHCLSY